MGERKNNYPEGFQVLCSNCNFAKGKYGSCPHTWEDKNIELAPQQIRQVKKEEGNGYNLFPYGQQKRNK